jgi:sarcosine oxidase subunit beta
VESVEVGIIGGGIHGVSAAYHLAAQGADVRLFEQDAPASGPTGRSSAVCRGYYVNAFLARMAAESLEMFRNFSALTNGGDAGFRRTGILYLHPAADLGELDREAKEARTGAVRVDLLRGRELAALCPGWDLNDIAVGAWEPDAGYADPVGTTQGLFARAVELGLRYRLYSRVSALSARPGGGAILTAQDGSQTSCRRLLIAAGPWTRPLARQLGADLPLSVERHTIAVFGWGTATPIPFSYADLVGGFYVKPEGENLYTVGSLREDAQVDPDSYSATIADAEVMAYVEPLTRRIPDLSRSDSRGGWASLYDVSPDWQPVIGEVADGVFVDAGTSGHGFKLAPALGRWVGEMLTGAAAPELEQFHPRRFAENAPLRAGYAGARILG